MKKLLLAALVFAFGCGVAGLIILKRPGPEKPTAPTARVASQPAPAPRSTALPPLAPPEPPAPAVAPLSPAARTLTNAALVPEPPARPLNANKSGPRSAPSVKPPKEPLKDPVAREALALVGMDPLAEEYWYSAINDPELSAHERQDLIEDLNEDGLSDPKNPAPGDLPVILSRLRIIEQSAPYAMDQVNADAFQEAYKDLVNLANRAVGAGEPVR